MTALNTHVQMAIASSPTQPTSPTPVTTTVASGYQHVPSQMAQLGIHSLAPQGHGYFQMLQRKQFLATIHAA